MLPVGLLSRQRLIITGEMALMLITMAPGNLDIGKFGWRKRRGQSNEQGTQARNIEQRRGL